MYMHKPLYYVQCTLYSFYRTAVSRAVSMDELKLLYPIYNHLNKGTA